MATLEDYKYIKAYYTGAGGGGGNNSNLGKITFSVPKDAVELPFRTHNNFTFGMENGCVYYSSNPDGQINDDLAVYEAKAGILTKISNPSGYFYFIKMGDIFIADRIVALGTSYNELYEAGYINGRFRSPSKEEYETILSSEEEKYNIDIWHKNNNYQGYSTFYGEISSTLNSSNNVWVYGLLGITGDWSFGGDFYHTQYASAWNSTSNRNYLFGGNGWWYMLGSYRPVIDIKNMKVIVCNNLELSE